MAFDEVEIFRSGHGENWKVCSRGEVWGVEVGGAFFNEALNLCCIVSFIRSFSQLMGLRLDVWVSKKKSMEVKIDTR